MARKPKRHGKAGTINTSAQKANVARFAIGWSGLTEENHDAWSNYAADRPRPNRVGVNRSPSGYEEFMKYHLQKAVINTTIFDDPPPDPESQTLTNFSMTSDLVTGINVAFQVSIAFSTRRAHFYGRPLFRDTIPKFNNDFKFFADLSTITGEFELTAAWDAVFPTPIENQVIAVRVVVADFPNFVVESTVNLFAKTTP